jgi:hypothetical protein
MEIEWFIALTVVSPGMSGLHYSPGPAAEEAFTLGIAAAVSISFAGLGYLFWADMLTLTGLILTTVLGLPVLLIVVSCLLSVWLGYNKDALGTALS